jgi:hypothetical protein
MDDYDKRELAKLLVPHLAWDLTRAEVMTFESRPDMSGVGGAMFVDQVAMLLRSKIVAGETFTVAIIPSTDGPRRLTG